MLMILLWLHNERSQKITFIYVFNLTGFYFLKHEVKEINKLIINYQSYLLEGGSFFWGNDFQCFLRWRQVAVTFSNTRKGKTAILKYVLLSVTLGIYMHFKNILNKSW